MKRSGICVALFILMAGVIAAQTDLQPIANVKYNKTEPITLKQLKTRVEAYQKELGRVMTIDEKKKVLDTLINERLVVQAADKEGIKVSDSEVNQNFNQMISQQVGRSVTEIEYASMVKQQTGMTLDDMMKQQNGMSLSEYKSFLRSQIMAQRYVMLKKQADLQNLPPPADSEIRSYYEVHKQNFVQPDMVKLFLVVVPKGDDAAAAKAKAQDFQKQLKDKPASAAEIKIRSQAAGSGFQAGDLYVNKNATASQQLGITMDSLLKIFGMSINETSEVSETSQDFQCFVVLEKYPAKILELSDVAKPGTTITIYEYIKNNMVVQTQNKAVTTALQQIIDDLRKGDNFQILKSDADLEKALTW
jgi:parvulin-like peptidyl-prolyl isomerase